MALAAGQSSGPVRSRFGFFMRDIPVTVDTDQLGFLDVDLMGDLHVMGCFHAFRPHLFMAYQAVVIDPLIGKKIAGEELTDFRMAIRAGDALRMNRRGRPHGEAGLSCVTRKTDRTMGGQEVAHQDHQTGSYQGEERTHAENDPFRLQDSLDVYRF
jgi:hypothetical protein